MKDRVIQTTPGRLLRPAQCTIIGTFLFAQPVLADPESYIADVKRHRQTGIDQIEFLGGELHLLFQEGSVTIADCDANGSDLPVEPGQSSGCSLGTNCLVFEGDINGDGVVEGGPFWAVTEIEGAGAVAPFMESQVTLEGPLQSDLPFDSIEFDDRSARCSYDFFSPPSDVYTITRYYTSRFYGPNELEEQRGEAYPGSYTLRAPHMDPGEDPFPLSVFLYPGTEAWPGAGPTPSPYSWKLLSPASWQDKVLKVDASIPNQFSWQGLSPETTFASESVRFSIVDESTGQVVFPAYPDGTPEADRLPLELPANPSSVEVGAGIVAAGTRGVARLEVARDVGTDRSRRTFEWVVDFLEMPNNRELFADMSTAGLFRFNAAIGFSYRIESSGNLKDWELEENGIPGTGGSVIRVYPIEPTENRFFRAGRE